METFTSGCEREGCRQHLGLGPQGTSDIFEHWEVCSLSPLPPPPLPSPPALFPLPPFPPAHVDPWYHQCAFFFCSAVQAWCVMGASKCMSFGSLGRNAYVRISIIAAPACNGTFQAMILIMGLSLSSESGCNTQRHNGFEQLALLQYSQAQTCT